MTNHPSPDAVGWNVAHSTSLQVGMIRHVDASVNSLLQRSPFMNRIELCSMHPDDAPAFVV